MGIDLFVRPNRNTTGPTCASCLRPMDQSAVYLDYNATTPLAPEVLDTVVATLRDAWGNPSSSHHAGELT